MATKMDSTIWKLGEKCLNGTPRHRNFATEAIVELALRGYLKYFTEP